MKKIRRADVILIVTLLILSVGLYFLMVHNRKDGQGVIVSVDGQEIARYALTEEGTYSLNGGTNILVIEDGSAYLIEADCPDHLCVKQGKIRGVGQVITCLPNKLTVTVYGVKADVELIS